MFEIEKKTAAEIVVIHIEEGHRYTFLFVISDGRRAIGDGAMRDSGSGKHSAQYFYAEARQFVEAAAPEQERE